ncbi:MAG TPA: pilus assembly protein PilM, partial [Thermoanaerobaculia bacterium]|nr:pilus assembly protein PilM [Thermoanaerobaculia bacterium]
MARSCGIRIGPRRFELIVLDGSPKKHRVTAFHTGEFPRGGENPAADAAAALKAAVKACNVPTDNVGVAIDTGLASFRTLKMPDLDEDKIEAVLKFEVESELPQWNIDDIVIDFQKIDAASGETSLLVSAVPKADIAREIDVAARAGVEPLEVELEATAMINAALSAEVCHADDAQVLVHVGEVSTAIVLMDGARVRSMRAVHIGALSHEPALAEPEADVAGEEGAAEGRDAPPAEDSEDRERRLEQVASRVRRELLRTVSGARTANAFEGVHVCGWPLPGLVGSEVEGVPIVELDVFEEDSEEVGKSVDGAGPLVVAYGVALRMLGGGSVPGRLRREELRYSGTFERVELPLAIASLLLVTLLAVVNIFELKQIKHRTADVDLWRVSTNNYMLGDMRARPPVPGNLDPVPDTIEKYFDSIRSTNEVDDYGINPERDVDRTRLEQMQFVRNQLRNKVAELDRELGNTGEIQQPQSALEAGTLVLGVLNELDAAEGRPALRRVNSTYQFARTGGSDSVLVTLDLTFF